METQLSTHKRPSLLTIPVLRDIKPAEIVRINSATTQRGTTDDVRAVAAGFGFVLSFIMFALLAGVVIPFQA